MPSQTEIRSHDLVVQGRTKYVQLPTETVNPFIGTTPNVANVEVFELIAVAPITVTNFIGGAPGQSIKILGDGNTTIAHNTNIKTNTGADKLLLVEIVYRFTYFPSAQLWVEDE